MTFPPPQFVHDSSEWMTLIVRSMPVALYIAEPDSTLTGPRILSDEMAQQLGYQAADFIADPALWVSRIHPDDLPEVTAHAKALGAAGALAVEYRWRTADGSERMFADQGLLIRDKAGRPAHVQGIAFDVTDRYAMEHRLVRAQKMAAIGRLSGGIAHEINNLLTVIMWNLDMMTRSLAGGSKDFDRAHIALSAVLKGTGLMQRLLNFTKQDEGRVRPIDLAEFLPRVVQTLLPVIGADTIVELRLSPGLAPVAANPTQLELALVNMGIHLRGKMSESDCLVIEAHNSPHDESRGLSTASVMLTITGIPSEAIAEVDASADDALAMVGTFAHNTGGRLTVESGTEGIHVRLLLPCGDPVQPEIADDEHHVVLVVEDDADVRNVTVAGVVELGYRVLEAASAEEALDILGRDEHIDLLFTDISMAGMNGFELARRTLKLRPRIKILFASGYIASARNNDGPTNESPGSYGEFLKKPYRHEELARALHRSLVQ